MKEEKKDGFYGGLPPLPIDNNVPPSPSADFPPPPQNFSSPAFSVPTAPSMSQPEMFSSGAPDYERRFQDMEHARENLVKMLDEVQTKHENEKQLWEEKLLSLQGDSASVLDEFAARQLKEDEARAKREAEINEEKIKLQNALKEQEKKLEEARDKTFLQALKAKEDETTAVRLEAAMKDAQLKNMQENAPREIESIRIKLEAVLSEKLLSLQKQYENKLAEVYMNSSQKEKGLISKLESLQAEKEAVLRQTDVEKEKINREMTDKIFKRQNEINLLTVKLEEAKENYNKRMQLLQGELTSAKAEILLNDAKVKADYEGKLNQMRSVMSEAENKTAAVLIQMESEKKIAAEKLKSKEDELAAIPKQFLEREAMLKTGYEKQIAGNTSDKNRLEAEVKSAAEKMRGEYERKIEIIQNEKKIIEQEIFLKKAEFEKSLREKETEWHSKIGIVKNDYENKLRENDTLKQKIEMEHNAKIVSLNNSNQQEIMQFKDRLNQLNQVLSQERSRFEKLISEKEKETAAVKLSLQDEIKKQREFYEESLLEKDEKISLITADFEKKELSVRSALEKRLAETLSENVKIEVKFRNEIETLNNEYTRRLSVSLDEKTEIEKEFRSRIEFLEKEHLKEIDLLKERLTADAEKQRQELLKRIDSEIASKNELDKNYHSAIAQKTAELEKNAGTRDEEWRLKTESIKNEKSELEKNYRSAIDRKTAEFEKNSRERDEEWYLKIEKTNADYENRLRQEEAARMSLQQEMLKKLEENNAGWQKKLEAEKKYLEDKAANYGAELETRKKQWADELEKYRAIITGKENDILAIKTNYENRLTEMSKSEIALKAMIERLSADLLSEREKFSKELSAKTKEFEEKYEDFIKTKNTENVNNERLYKSELKSAAVENETKIAELKNEISLAGKETEELREKWLEDKKQFTEELAKKAASSGDEQRSFLIKKAELEAMELKLKMSERAINDRIDIEKRKYEEMVDVKNEQLEFLKEQIKRMEKETDEKIKAVSGNFAADKSLLAEKTAEAEKLREEIIRYKITREKLEKEISDIAAENKLKDEKIGLMKQETEFQISVQRGEIEKEFRQKMFDIEKRYEKERKSVEESLLNANAQDLAEIERLKKDIEAFKSAQAFQKTVSDAKKDLTLTSRRSSVPLPEVQADSILTGMWRWLNEPVWKKKS